jgi:cytochrome b561
MGDAAMPTPAPDYAPLQRRLHWIIAAAMFALILVGLWIPTVNAETDRAFKDQLYMLHKSTGMVVFALAVWRLVVKLRRPVAPAEGLTPFEAAASRYAHKALYALMIAMPLAGWTSSSALGFPVTVFGALPLPDLVPKNAPLGFFLLAVHQWLAWVLIPLLAVHVAAAVYHYVFRGDRVLQRMLGKAG